MTRIVLAFLLAPLAVPLLIAAQDMSSWLQSGTMGYHWRRPLAIALLVGYPLELALGLPAFLVMRSRGWLHWRHFALGGLSLGALPGLPWLFMGWPGLFALGVLAGAVSALVFWAVGVAGNSRIRLPERAPPAAPEGKGP